MDSKDGTQSESQIRSSELVRRPGYKFCETHQQEYREYCCGCALQAPRANTGNVFRDAMFNNRGNPHELVTPNDD